MELIYLWVEDYKNIKDQDFNFSPHFEASYDKKNTKLIINDKDSSSEDFFGKNINVTAIVGENGSGKSGILELILELLKYDMLGKKYILVLNLNTTNYYISNIHQLSTNLEKFTNKDLDFFLYTSQQKIDDSQEEEEKHHKILLSYSQILNMITSQYVSSIEFKLSSFMYIPERIDIKDALVSLIRDVIGNEQFNFSNINFGEDLTDRQEDKEYKDARNQQFTKEDNLNNLFYENNFGNYHKFLMLWYIREFGYDDNDYQLEDIDFLLSEYTQFEEFLDEQEFQKYFQDKSLNINTLNERDKSIYFNWYKDYFEFDFIDSKNRKYNNLSYGEQTIFGQFLSIYYNSLNSNKENILYLFDEPDISLHPQWQKQYLNELLTLIQKLNKKCHFIFTTHSPFLLSDLTNENIIFLQKDKETGGCNNLTNDIEINPFGANIHTLLSHAFFMQEGIMGDYAKEKINEVINNIQGKKDSLSKKQMKSVISQIGEPFLKLKIEQMYNEKFDIGDELEELHKQQQQIHLKIQQLNKEKSENAES